MILRILPLILILSFTARFAGAQTSQATPPCSDPGYRQFDFWLGEWEVEANGKPAGHSHITRILGGCVIFEEWESVGGGFAGKSLNRYDANDESWHQQWVDNQGTVLDLTGGRDGDRMILEGSTQRPDGTPILNRITWTNNGDGTVRQVWETSQDEGETWTAVFDGLYRPVKP